MSTAGEDHPLLVAQAACGSEEAIGKVAEALVAKETALLDAARPGADTQIWMTGIREAAMTAFACGYCSARMI